MSKEFGNHFVRKSGQPAAPAHPGLPSRPVILPPKRVEPKPAPAPEPAAEAAPEPKKFQVKPGPIRVEIKKKGAAQEEELTPAQIRARAAQTKRLTARPPFTRIFRWQLPEGRTQPPALVEVAGTFNNWQKIPLAHDDVSGFWHVTVDNIPGHRTHHYMLFVDGMPATDKFADGTAEAQTPQEEAVAVSTPRGPRVYILFARAR